ncbi:MAG: hypothetical protein C5S49_08635 [Candidatus Methanogaster sp.]|nr:MAG: hypothetical protein C5S49_08635 [ANME-2 cluster archaeon]
MACILKNRFICRKSNLLQVRAPELPILHANPFGRCIPPQLPAPTPLLHSYEPTGGASARDTTTRGAPAARIACDEACTARMGGGGGEDSPSQDRKYYDILSTSNL